MSWTAEYTASAARAIRRLDPGVRRRIRAAVETLLVEPERGKRLHFTLQGLRSWRTGDFRIVYRIEQARLVILVVAVGHRSDVYDRLRRLAEK